MDYSLYLGCKEINKSSSEMSITILHLKPPAMCIEMYDITVLVEEKKHTNFLFGNKHKIYISTHVNNSYISLRSTAAPEFLFSHIQLMSKAGRWLHTVTLRNNCSELFASP